MTEQPSLPEYTCPICGYPHIEDNPASFLGNICPSCGFEFGYDDLDQGYTYQAWRQKWIEEGMRWQGFAEDGDAEPLDWDPSAQLKRITGELP